MKIVISLNLMTGEISVFFISSNHIFHKSENNRGVVEVWENVNEESKLADLVRLPSEIDKVSLIHEAAALKRDCLIRIIVYWRVLRILVEAGTLKFELDVF